jgi:hypothetical protein
MLLLRHELSDLVLCVINRPLCIEDTSLRVMKDES